MPALLAHERFSENEGLTRADVGPSRPGDDFLSSDCGHLPLFSSARIRSIQAASPKGGGLDGSARLSMGHSDIKPTQISTCATSTPPPKPPEIVVWAKGSRSDFAALEFLNMKPRHSPPRRLSPRGIILSHSASSRRNHQRKLATVDRSADAFTMCLSCPGVWKPSDNPAAKADFLRLLKQMTASRDSRIRSVGLGWKQEIQSREAVHYHLLLWGVTAETRAFVQDWIATRWNRLVCRRCDDEGRAKHLTVHLHSSNFQQVRDFSGYFAKYLGKDAEAVLVGDPIPGRWWGFINSDCIPWAEKSVLVNPPARFLVTAHRLARKVRQKRANAAKHAAIQRKVGLVYPSGPNKGKPVFSQLELECGHNRVALRRQIESLAGVRLGPYAFPAALKTGAICLIGAYAPAVAKQILQFAGDDLREYMKSNPF